jgi:4-hydroxyproline epimerase
LPWRASKLIRVVDSHTGGEPTRVVIDAGAQVERALRGSMAEQREQLQTEQDWLRSACVNEPRGSDVMVGALLRPPTQPDCTAGVIFFNNVGYLGMCGHGTIGLISTLAWLGRIGPGQHRIETPVGVVTTRLHDDGGVSVRNVPAYRHSHRVTVMVPGRGEVTGDVAWGGNWFFLVDRVAERLDVAHADELVDFTWRIRQALVHAGITGAEGAEIDHIELHGAPLESGNDARNFVLCPGKAYDRSPCGTGTSAKLACLHADGRLAPGSIWRQESVTGSVFEGSIELLDGKVVPTVRGEAFITAESTLILDPDDPLRFGLVGT